MKKIAAFLEKIIPIKDSSLVRFLKFMNDLFLILSAVSVIAALGFLVYDINNEANNFKESIQVNKEYKKFIKYGIFDNLYGLCLPVINIKYQRKYIKVFSQRTTIDSNIEYQNYISKKIIKDHFNQIIEIKTSINEDLNKLNSNFPFRRSRFSKYSEAIKMLKIKN